MIIHFHNMDWKMFSSMASKLINIRWIRTGSQPYTTSYYQQFSTNNEIKIIKFIPDSRITKLVLILKFLY